MSEKSSWQNKISELDSFWNLDTLISKPPAAKKDEVRPSKPSSAEIVIDGDKRENTVIKKYIIPPALHSEKDEKPEKEYTFENSLIHSVRIYPWKSNYNYYENFYSDVKRFRNVTCGECEAVKFFSYVPQYSQMNTSQLKWYFYWREKARYGEFLPIDYSYIILYIFEIINSEYKTGAGEAIKQLCLLWKNYRKTYPQLDKYLSDWICDFGLINNVFVPHGIFGREMTEIMQHAVLKEFYASSYIDDSDGFVDIILGFCSNYDYKKSRYYGENKELYDSTIRKTMRNLIDSGAITGFDAEDCSMKRDSYVGALCSFHAKKKIEIKYCSFSRTNEFRFIIGDIIKYIENKIRTYLSIKSKLGVFSLSDDTKKEIDGIIHFDSLKKQVRKKTDGLSHDYDKLYDVPKKEFSISDANKIENDSWETTKKLVEAFEEDEPKEKIEEEKNDIPEPKTENNDGFEKYIGFLVAVKDKDYALQRSIAKESEKMTDSIADEINNRALEVYGDVLIEDDGMGYAVIPEYEEVLENLIKSF